MRTKMPRKAAGLFLAAVLVLGAAAGCEEEDRQRAGQKIANAIDAIVDILPDSSQ